MTNKVLPKTALISVSNKSGVVTFAKLLQKNGVKICLLYTSPSPRDSR